MKKEKYYISFTKEMKKDYTILAPNMLPMHFKLILNVFKGHGYKMELLETQGRDIIETGLKYVHNDTCYPAILVIGQFINALQSGKYDPHKTALLLSQTGGGCRASNYIALLRKALKNAGYGFVPVISFSLGGLEDHPGFKITLPLWHRMFYAVIYGDLLLSLVNQVRPYEITPGESEALAERYCREIAEEMNRDGISFQKVKRRAAEILKSFQKIPTVKTEKVRVGVVGEIYVKFSPFGNNNLADFLVSEGAEVVVPGLLDFCLYCVINNIADARLYGRGVFKEPFVRLAYRFVTKKQKEIIELMKADGHFRPPTPIDETVKRIVDYIGIGAKMGEGWLLPAEMLELYESGVPNIVCTQPFGCLPNHIFGKGMMKPLKAKNPDINIVAIDYDASATGVNQENRIKLMLANAREQMEKAKKASPKNARLSVKKPDEKAARAPVKAVKATDKTTVGAAANK